MTAVDPRQCYSTDEVASLIGVAPATLRTWRHRAEFGPKSFKIGGRVVYLAADVNAWIDARYAETVTA